MKSAQRVVIDACVLISAFKADEPQHASAADLFVLLDYHHIEVCAPALLFPEIAGALARPMRDVAYAARVIDGIRHVLPIRIYPLDESLAAGAEAIARECFIRGADAGYAALAKRLHAPLITLDRELLERGCGTFRALTPGEWVKNRLH